MISRVNEVVEFVGGFIEIHEFTYSHFTPTFDISQSRDVGDGWADQLNLSEPEGEDCAPPPTSLLLAHPALGSFLRHCLRVINFSNFSSHFSCCLVKFSIHSFDKNNWPNNLLKNHKENLVWTKRPLVKILFGYGKVSSCFYLKIYGNHFTIIL